MDVFNPSPANVPITFQRKENVNEIDQTVCGGC